MRFGGLRAVRSHVVTGADLDASVFIVCVVWVCYVGKFFSGKIACSNSRISQCQGNKQDSFCLRVKITLTQASKTGTKNYD